MVFQLANRYPASVAFTVQLLAALFGVIHVAVICKLINYALRLRLRSASVSLDVLRTWVDMTIPRIDWDLPLRFFFPVTLMVFFSLVPAALWAGSFAPLVSSTSTSMVLRCPDYTRNISLIKEYPMEIGKAGPSYRNSQGLFTFSVGQQLIGPLLSAAAGASSNDSLAKITHPKIDNTQFSYTGRSYGVGSSAGLTDLDFPQANAAGYKYNEYGYLTTAQCIYNQSSNFTLSGPVNEWIYAAAGTLPDSVEGPEYSNYIGHNAKAIVAMGVAYSELSPRRYVAITAGEFYAHLNNTQCEFDFAPTMFEVTVDLANLNITVKPTSAIPETYIHESDARNITRTVVRQFELLSNDLTNLYDSLLGQALNSSIAAYSMSMGGSWPPLTQEERTLGGLANAMIAMADDMLVAYGSAQLMVGTRINSTTSVPRVADVYLYALQFGQPAYIYAVFALNTVIVLAVLVERYRTRVWADLTRFNYLDPRDLIVAASRGGEQLAHAADDMVGQDGRKVPRHVWLLSDPDEGNGRLVVRLRADEGGHAAIEVDEARSEALMGEGWVSYEDVGVDEEKAVAKEAWERREKGRVGVFGSAR
ncbi:uncharacterized protein N0V89_000345 [Didymosphaeria variabile]|uniref:Uncharacterized protein n=1 Tax=Didymosphaeria variabile TaxID=1932322 RepID=A0A9W8XX84_9PLEO|nr:uncharacterized protein N0V89_000345 [Didymosphaeria variabile]KAJ4359789.1 hypothetical protein N0V89_000345 [Didymosphaeria variabile]